jgi:S1-C subfamily serine protease
MRFLMSALVSLIALSPQGARCAQSNLVAVIAKIKPSIVGVGTLQQTRNPAAVFTGTGFAVADGRHVVTNAHVLPRKLDTSQHESLIVLVGGAEEAESRNARVVGIDRAHDIALLQIDGSPLPALVLGDSQSVREGMSLAFTGFPIGMALGLYPATHRATLAALVPVARAGLTARQLTPRLVSRLRDSAYVIFQLDATAYPGNSGSPLYDPEDGLVYGIVNSVFIQGTREQAIRHPSGITYAIPSGHIRDLLKQAQVVKE